MTKFIAAAVQVGSQLFDVESTVKMFENKLNALSNIGADIAVFPVAFFGGYPKGVDFKTVPLGELSRLRFRDVLAHYGIEEHGKNGEVCHKYRSCNGGGVRSILEQ